MNTEKIKWAFDPAHSKVNFKVKHLMISNVRGTFKQFDGEVTTSGSDFADAEVYFKINTGSIETEDEQRNTHLRSADFFDSEKYPEMIFKSASMKDLGDETYELEGTLKIKDIEKPVKLEVEFGGIVKDPWGNEKAGLTVEGKINRKDWDLNWNAMLEAGGVLVGEEVKITCDIELTKLVKQEA